MPKINPYLIFNGNCEEAFNFYKSVFGGEFSYIGRFSDMPEEHKGKEGEENLIMHVSLPIGAEILMGSDTNEANKVNFGNNISISINADSKQEANRIHSELSAGGKVTMQMADTFWGSYFGMLTDKFGISWMISYDKPKE